MYYVLRRLLTIIPVMLVVAILTFLLVHLSPGDPAAQIAGNSASTADIARLHANLGLDQPLWQQYLEWMRQIATGDLGTSLFTKVSVGHLIASRMAPTLSIAAITIVLAVIVGIPLGVAAAYRAGSWVDRLVMVFSVLAFSIPGFLIGYLLIFTMGVHMHWFPVSGYVPFSRSPAGWIHSLTLPCINIALIYIALITRMTRATVLEALSEDYIRTARAKGMGMLAVLNHALRNAAVPIATTVGTGIALLIGGVVVTETVFAIPGLGRLVIDSVQRRDYPVIQGVLLISAGAYVVINLLIDLSYGLFDPRIRN